MVNQSTAAQRERVLHYLRVHGSATTIELRHELDVLMPAARIFELRHNHNHNIATTWRKDDNPNGGSHNVAKYVLKVGKFKEVGK